MATTSLSARRKAKDRHRARTRRHRRVRKQIFGEPGRPRLSVFRSSKHIYAQVIDDISASTLAAACTLDPTVRDHEGTKTEAAKHVGQLLAERAKAAGIDEVMFDRGGYKYHGRVAALADGAREGGLRF